MEINFKEMELIAPALNRIADALELLAGKSNVTHARESAAADQPETPEEKPKKKKAAPKKAASDDELTEQTMRKFAAEAVKKGLKKTPAIIKVLWVRCATKDLPKAKKCMRLYRFSLERKVQSTESIIPIRGTTCLLHRLRKPSLWLILVGNMKELHSMANKNGLF